MMGLHVDSVRKEIGGRTILNDVFLSCTSGEIVGILGRNGAGKTTLLKIVFGSLVADYKFVSVEEKRTGKLFSTRNLIQYLPQHKFLPSHVKISSIISCFCDKKQAALLMGNELIKPFLKKKTDQLSTGERRLVEISLFLFSNAKYILFDEPFNGIAPLYVEQIKDLIRKHGKDKGLIITGQDYRNIIELSSRLVLIKDGNTRMVKDLQELIDYGYLPESAELPT
jgi:ABC-type multidrug transport system ATPase subunit